MVEFALVIIVMLLFVFVVIEGARLLQAWVTIQNAAREGGRYAITGQSDPDCAAYVPPCDDPRVEAISNVVVANMVGLNIADEQGWGNAGDYTIEVHTPNELTPDPGDWRLNDAGNPGQPVLVRVTYFATTLTPFFELLNVEAPTFQLSAQVIMNNGEFLQVSNTQTYNDAPDVPPPPTAGPPAVDVNIEKVTNVNPAIENDPYNYILTITNIGAIKATNVVITDVIPAELTVLGTTHTSGVNSCLTNGNTVTCDIDYVLTSDSHEINIEVLPTLGGGDAITITNTALVSSQSFDVNLDNNTSTISTTVVPIPTEADLSVSKSSSNNPIIIDTDFSYSISVFNYGLAAAPNVVVTDTLPAGVTYQGSVPPAACTYSIGTNTAICNLGNLARDEAGSVLLNVTAPGTTGFITNTVSVGSDAPDPDLSDNTFSLSTEVIPETVDLAVTISDSPDPVPAGEPLNLGVIVSNSPNLGTANNVVLTIQLSQYVTYTSASPTQGSCSLSGTTLTCNLGSISPSGAVAVPIIVVPYQTGTIITQVAVTSDEIEDDNSDNTDVEVTSVQPNSDLVISKNVDNLSPNVGDTVRYAIVVSNFGPSDAGNVVVFDDVPIEMNLTSANSTQGTCSINGNEVTCYLGSIPVNGSASVYIFAVPVQVGTITNEATTWSNNYDPNVINNTDDVVLTANSGSNPYITLIPTCGEPGDQILLRGFLWATNGAKIVNTYWNPTGSNIQLDAYQNTQPSWTRNITIPMGVADGAYIIRSIRSGKVAESTFTIPCPSPNIEVAPFSVITPTIPITGVEEYTPIQFFITYSNSGSIDINSQFFLAMYDSPDPAPITTTTFISDEFRISTLAARSSLGAGELVSQTIWIPGLEGVGDHDIYFFADTTDTALERDEVDNIWGPYTISVITGTNPITVTPTPTGQPTGTLGAIAGQVFITGPGGQLIPQSNAEIKLFDQSDGSLVTSMLSNEDGIYIFANLPAGTYTINGCLNLDGNNLAYTVTGVILNQGSGEVRDLFLEEEGINYFCL
ncbi:MAG TPA: TadE/TadG family type IV pilus assembly protein [Anaerolineae bacterium]|nr:TadE/TadG family type IV pilus assembly protein [Anaerolineae bacterium]